MSAPAVDIAVHEMQQAEMAMNFQSPEWTIIEQWLSWRRYKIALSMLAEKDDDTRAKMHGMATMCMELIKLGEQGRADIAKHKDL